MAAVANLNIQKIALSLQRNDRFWRNLVQWCIWALQTPTADKILWTRHSKMAAAAILKNRKIIISLRPINLFWQNLTCRCDSTLDTRIANKILRFRKSKMAAVAILKIRKIVTSPQWNDQFWWNLVKWCVWAIWPLSANKMLWIRQYKMAAATILKNRTSSSALAERPRDALVSRNSATTVKNIPFVTRVPGLSCGIICVILRLAVFTQYRSVTDTHAQTDRWTDRYTTTACIASRGKNRP